MKTSLTTWLQKWFEIILICAALLGPILAPLLAHGSSLEATYVGVEIKLVGSNVMASFAKDWPKQDGRIDAVADFSLSNDLHQQVQDQQLTPSEALEIETELIGRQGASYYVPHTQSELKQAVGFPSDTPLSPEDLVDLVPVHLQVTLGVSPVASSYLTEKMGIRARQAPEEKGPEKEPEKLDPNPPPVPAAAPGSAALPSSQPKALESSAEPAR